MTYGPQHGHGRDRGASHRFEKLGLQAGAFIGLFLGFSLAVVSALTQPDELERLVRFMCVTPLLCAVVLGPFLGWRRAPKSPMRTPLIPCVNC